MGAAASITAAEQQRLHGDRAKPAKREEQVSSSVRSYNRGSVRGSVRQMALMNHARQENSYISADKLSSQFSGPRKEAGAGADPKPAAQRKFKADHPKPAETSLSDHKVISSTAPKIENIPEEPAQGKLQSLSMFRSTFNLKLNLSADDDNNSEDENEGNLNKFDNRLIAIPSVDEGNAAPAVGGLGMGAGLAPIGGLAIPPPVNSSPQKTKEGKMQTDANGALFVDGLNLGVGSQGLIRPDRDSKSSRLPMSERLILMCKLGAGASSAVYKALDLQDMRLVALKTIQVYDKDKRVQMIRELSALFSLIKENSRRESTMHIKKLHRRPEKYIVDFYDAFSNLEEGVVCLMIEYMDGGSLQDIADQGGCDDEAALANISIQALKGLGFLHSNLQLHRDLKPANFLISHRGEVKVADLGILKQLPAPRPGHPPRTNSFVGTASYMSPERIDGKEYGLAADVWAFGLTLVTLALGKLPLDTQGGYWTILNTIRDAPPPTLPNTFSADFRDFIAACLQKNPDNRPNVAELLKHKFLTRAVPDDLTLDLSMERGKKELLSIAEVVVAHLRHLREELKERYSDAEGEKVYVEEASAAHSRTFGNLLSDPLSAVVRRLFFPDDEGWGEGAARGAGQVDGVGALRMGMLRRKPRLAALARQLHLPIEVVQAEMKNFVLNMQEKEAVGGAAEEKSVTDDGVKPAEEGGEP